MSPLARRRLSRGVSALNRALGTDVSCAAVEAICKTHEKQGQLARIVGHVLQFEADPAAYAAEHSYAKRLHLNHRCDFAASEAVSRALSLFFDSYDFSKLPGYDAGFVDEGCSALEAAGCFVKERYVSPGGCGRILDFLSDKDIVFREDLTGKLHRGYSLENVENTTSNCCRITDHSVLLSCPEVEKLLFDPNLLDIAQRFLGAPPIHTQINCWWSVPYSEEYEFVSAGAQRFHQDRDHIKFIKFFLYLTDVGDDNGPHEFVAGSNVDYALHGPRKYRSSKRLTDEFLRARYAADRFRRFAAPMGSMLVEDTSGFHKGTTVVSGHRVMLQLEFVSTLFSNRDGFISKKALVHVGPQYRGFDRLLMAYAEDPPDPAAVGLSRA